MQHETFNQLVVGSIPTPLTNKNNSLVSLPMPRGSFVSLPCHGKAERIGNRRPRDHYSMQCW
jgi:hypothetical protein